MYDIRQFKPALYCLLLLGILAFALAAQSAAVWMLAAAALLVNGWLVWRGWFRPMPRVVSNVITIAAFVYMAHEVFQSPPTAVLMIGQYLMLLQVVKLWEQRGNRDYGQLLVLSLLLMVAAAINTGSMIFGILLVGYLFLALYCCLLFHLKVETDAARAAMKGSERRISPAVLRQDQRHLTLSMRKLTAVVSLVSIIFAVIIFIFFPRGVGAGMLGPMQLNATQTMVGFNDHVSFQEVARISQNDAIVGYVWLSHNGKAMEGGMPLLLRGVTLDTYSGGAKARWSHYRNGSGDSVRAGLGDPILGIDADVDTQRDQTTHFNPDLPTPADRWEQHIKLLPTGTDVLFAMAGPYSIKSAKQALRLRYIQTDGTIRNRDVDDHERPPDAIEYTVESANKIGGLSPERFGDVGFHIPGFSGLHKIDPKIREYATRADVSGANAAGPLFQQRGSHLDGQADALDADIARNIEQHLKKNFGYTLDLTDTRKIEGRDPMVAFLYDFKKGHCEYFAGAMTLMCQSLGMKARMCLGFHSDEYNGTPGANCYIIRQSHAHAWVEVLTQEGWMTFDPTSESDVAEQARHNGLAQKIRHFFNFLEYAYADSVIAYSNENRQNVIQTTESVMVKATMRSTSRLDYFGKWRIDQMRASAGFWTLSARALNIVVALMAIAAVALIGRFTWQSWQLRRRASRIGIDSLPPGEQQRLARQLVFYDELLQLLGRRHIIRKPHQTPLEFSQSLLFLSAESYATVRRLTELFYRVRYGRAEMTADRQRKLANILDKLEKEMGTRKWARPQAS